MMNLLEEAIIYATIMHQGKTRKLGNYPYILHPLEVAQILSTMTDDEELIAAGILHDIVEDTDGTLEEIEERFGSRVAELVSSESENKYPEQTKSLSWKRRKEESLLLLKNNRDTQVRMLWLADKLSNIRSLAGMYAERGSEIWQELNQTDPAMHRWYYKSIAEIVELQLNRTGAFKEFIKHINFIWPGTFDSEKGRFKKYKEVSIDGCELIGRGAKGNVYRYDDETVIKVFNSKNTYQDVEQEIALSRKAFILGVPTAISFGIKSVGAQYGAMYELVDSNTISSYVAANPQQVEDYASLMADLAHTIHSITVTEDDGFPYVTERLTRYITTGIAYENEELAQKCMALLKSLPASNTLVHGDFHSGNVFLQRGEPLLIDMDRLAMGHPIAEISDLYYFYVVLGEDDPSVIEDYMGFSYETSQRFFDGFLKHYLQTEDESKIREVTEKASLLCYSRLIHKIHKKRGLTDADQKTIIRCTERIAELTEKLDTLEF